MINFRQIKLEDKPLYEQIKKNTPPRGCEMSFANLYLWGKQDIAFINGHALFLSTFSKSFYPFPVGEGDKKPLIDEIIKDSKERNIPLLISAICEEEKQILESLYPNEFEFSTTIDSYDYVYSIDDLAELKGKKYHKKRTHLNNFYKNYPNYTVEPFTSENIDKIKEMVDKWYEEKEGDFDYEKEVFRRAMENYEALELEGLAIINEGEVLAVTFGSRMQEDTFDVHFEKAKSDAVGAYPAINNEFAKYIRGKYPEIKYLDREEDMGLEGLRKAKESYYPHHQVVKYTAKKK